VLSQDNIDPQTPMGATLVPGIIGIVVEPSTKLTQELIQT
jgi:hypothetical protein